uniref:Conotoxin superfamily W n=1 Tax=Conus ermineus TaxID=55423 RepID=A0A346CIG2_CONER|nr:conotoxin precursor superfamily W [Conus ermineus]
MTSPRLSCWIGSVGVSGTGSFMETVVERTWRRFPKAELTHAGSTTKRSLLSVGDWVGGVLRMVDQSTEHH